MKTARYLSTSALGFFLLATGAGAAPSSPDPTENPYAQTDPDGVPLSVTRPQPMQLSPADLEIYRKQQERAVADKNWLLRNYEQQLQNRNKSSAAKDQNANLYYQLTSNKELARLAGLPTLDSNSQDNTTSYRTGAAHSGPSALRADLPSTSAAVTGFAAHGNLFKPLVTPLSAPAAAGMPNFYSSLPMSMAPPASRGVSQTSSAPTENPYQESSDLETPGLVAAKKDPLSNISDSDLTLDVLPGESTEEARAHQENNTKLELPLPMDANQLHKDQAAALSVPVAPSAAKATAPAPVVKAVPIEDPDAPTPVSKVPQINPVRAPIANPYDLLNR
jgi:hypothetical protein